MKASSLNPGFWGISTALSWTWGLGLFFSVQFTFQFGLTGLLAFAIPNALGLFLFGAGTNYIAHKNKDSTNSLEQFFGKWAPSFSSVLFFYQLVALAITIFAISRYLFQALNLPNPTVVVLLAVIALLAVTFLLGEQFNITRIKYSHSVLFLVLLGCAGYLWFAKPASLMVVSTQPVIPQQLNFWSYLVPVCVGFFAGPWLDIQQWQKIIQMQKEKTSILKSYLFGSVVFFLILIFHGSITLWAVKQGAADFAREGIDGILYGQDIITRLLTSEAYQPFEALRWAYFGFLFICIITTLDSGYIAIQWFLKLNNKASKNVIFSMIPDRVMASPIPFFLLTALVSLVAVNANLESEYFMVFYATYFVGYSMVIIIRSLGNKSPDFSKKKTQLFAISILSLVISGVGYIYSQPLAFIGGSLLPLIYGTWVALKKPKPEIVANNSQALSFQEATEYNALPENNIRSNPITEHNVTNALASEYVDGKWYVHTFRATYGDTNSVGNVYFGMYPMWVGKTRELFFNHCLPEFNLTDTPYLILTRSFEHKFGLEAREFDILKIKIKVKSFNRKFAMLEHRVFDQNDKLLGKGTQTLLFVATENYEQLDIPQEVLTAFLPFTS